MSSSAQGGSGGGRDEKGQGLQKFIRRASKVLRRGSSSKGSLPSASEGAPPSSSRSPATSPTPLSGYVVILQHCVENWPLKTSQLCLAHDRGNASKNRHFCQPLCSCCSTAVNQRHQAEFQRDQPPTCQDCCCQQCDSGREGSCHVYEIRIQARTGRMDIPHQRRCGEGGKGRTYPRTSYMPSMFNLLWRP